jgi:hypothetical protein
MVYTIVFMENSPAIFHAYPNDYVHSFECKSDTGLELNLLQNYVFIPIDIFLEKLHNKGIENKLDAWLAFLGCDEIEVILDLISAYPEFKAMYSQLYDMCLNVEGVMQMFSKELQMLDHNTVRYMMDEFQETINEQAAQLKEKDDVIQEKNDALREKDNVIQEKDNTIKEDKETIKSLQEKVAELERKLNSK